MKLQLHRRAEQEIRAAAQWYRQRGEGLDLRFVGAVREAFELLESDPTRFSALETIAGDVTLRRVLLSDFSYVIVYEVFDSDVFVYAVAHASRRPNYWRRRKR